MHFHSLIVFAAGAVLAGMNGDADSQALRFDSYTRAWHAAADVKRPMLVILNPAAQEVSAAEAISVEKLRGDPALAKLLDNYVVAEIDTGTEHGRRVHEIFGSKPLPRIIVIDEKQEQQVYRTSEHVQQSDLKQVLQRYRQGTAVSAAGRDWSQPLSAPGSCPNCQRF